ncbi:uncharacterized protein LOC111636962 isoform X2 [Centruroides sculpturatus]|uniref:uncharacterized protein LOC111636962 isoform X2 n=1 Tax=Centruroides sculpturatus TaxID=218467 RepID=UPI000C6DDF33|nr:uncharacterized protein LOC111636962 isoform X2 [Centruroides sculpturatus]
MICQKWTINKKLLPMKLHYLFYSLAIGSALIYFPLIAKNIGISATGLGVMFTVVPFVTTLINPLFGCITDKFKKIKFIIMFLTILHTPIYFSIIYIPEISKEKYIFNDVKFHFGDDDNTSSIFIESSQFTTKNPDNELLKCKIEYKTCNISEELCQKSFNITSKSYLNSSTVLRVTNMTLEDNITMNLCFKQLNDKYNISCLLEEEINSFLYYQFWLFVLLSSSAVIITDVIIALSDAACYESLEGRVNQFGKQRLWLSFGWGVASMFTGYIVEAVNIKNKRKTDFSVCFYIMLPLMIFDIITLKFTNMRKEKTSNNLLKDISKIFVKPHPFFFITAVFLVGAFSGLQWNYSFWYLEELGGSKILMGISSAILCFFGDIPFMFISGWIIKRIGRDNSMSLAFVTFSIWFLTASYIYEPWLIILPYLVQGPSYGLFYAAMTSYGKLVAVEGTEATMQTVMGAAFHGLGIGTGSLFGGIGFDKYGARFTYRFVGYFAIGTAIVYKLITKFIGGEASMVKETDKKEEVNIEKTMMEESITERNI